MLKRIKIRGKLLLLLSTPLVAVMVFAYSGIIDRTERTTFQAGEARIAELANAGSDLSLAIQFERLGVLEIERMMLDDSTVLTDQRATTNARLQEWLGAADAAMGDLEDPSLRRTFDELAARLPTTLSPDRGADVVTGTLLASAGRAVDDATRSLTTEAEDLDLFRALTGLNSLTRVQSAYATITSVGSEAIFEEQMSAVAATLISEAERTAQNSITTFNESAEQAYVEGLLRLQTTGVLPGRAGGTVDSLTEVTEFINDTSKGGVEAWLLRGEEQLGSLNALIDTLVTDATSDAQAQSVRAADEARSFLFLAGSVVLLTLLSAVMIGRSITRPLSRLTRSAEQLSAEELPALVESMRTAGRSGAPALTPIEANGRDEVAQLARAISEIQQVTIDVAEEQGDLVRRGISEIFVNLARRNQSLLDRQIDFIDQLEASEENPDQLENLFRLDHLATRMRRNAESLLVLAGAEPTRRRGRPVAVIDVLRVAMGEIEDFGRIRMNAVEPSTVAGSVAVDLAHLMSELMENATQFSPPDIDVEAVGYRIADGSYQLTLADRGIGMSAEQVATANTTLAEPPVVGLDLSRSLGFTVVSRLANRLGITVRLTSSSEGGVTAVITIPAEMIGTPDADLDSPSTAETATLAELEPAPVPAVSESSIVTTVTVPAPELDRPETAPSLDATVLDDDLAKLPTRRPSSPAAPAPAPEPVAERSAPSAGDLFAAFGTPSDSPSAPADPDADLFGSIDHPSPLPTRAPALVRRTPKAAEPATDATGASPQQPTSPPTNRSPEEVRQMLSRYRAGLRKGRSSDPATDQTDPRSEGAPT
jgi:signal transduction histidine kinase